jgi:bifunctional DNA-binding transcriptional regulator/antitoxin component of YhaV-PrlF toxin-antitoxin module
MPNGHTQEEQIYIRTLTRVGKRSLSIVIPPEILESLDIQDREKVAITQDGDRIVIRKSADDSYAQQ